MRRTDFISRLECVQRDLDDGLVHRADQRISVLLSDLRAGANKRSWVFCANCGEDAKHMANGLCAPCYQYKWRTGRERPSFAGVKYCRGCRRNRKHHGHGYCASCYMRRFRAGKMS